MPWRSEADHANSRSRKLPTILTFTRGWGRNIFCFCQTAETGNRTPESGVKGSGANHYPRAPSLNLNWIKNTCTTIIRRAHHHRLKWVNYANKSQHFAIGASSMFFSDISSHRPGVIASIGLQLRWLGRQSNLYYLTYMSITPRVIPTNSIFIVSTSAVWYKKRTIVLYLNTVFPLFCYIMPTVSMNRIIKHMRPLPERYGGSQPPIVCSLNQQSGHQAGRGLCP